MALSAKAVELLKQIYAHHRYDHDQGLVDENPDEAIERLLQEIADHLGSRHHDSTPLYMVTESVVGGHNLDRIERLERQQARPTNRKAKVS